MGKGIFPTSTPYSHPPPHPHPPPPPLTLYLTWLSHFAITNERSGSCLLIVSLLSRVGLGVLLLDNISQVPLHTKQMLGESVVPAIKELMNFPGQGWRSPYQDMPLMKDLLIPLQKRGGTNKKLPETGPQFLFHWCPMPRMPLEKSWSSAMCKR